MRIRTFLKPLSFIPAILLMYMIFTFSSQEADVSSQVSYKVSTFIVKTADNILDLGLDEYQIPYYADRIHNATRKLAHMAEYFLLAIAVSFPLYVYGMHGLLLTFVAGAFCVAFAYGDEYHQSFVYGRASQTRDVVIDSVGILIGIIVVRIIGWTGRKTIFRPIPEDKLSRKEKKAAKKAAKLERMEQKQEAARREQTQEQVPYGAQPGQYPYGAQSGQYPYGAQSGQYPYGTQPGQNPYGAQPGQSPYGAQPGQYPYGAQGGQPTPDPYPRGAQTGGRYEAPRPEAQPAEEEFFEDDDSSSDELSEDMPFARLLGSPRSGRRKKRHEEDDY